MNDNAETLPVQTREAPIPRRRGRSIGELVYRHRLPTRLWHWTNAVAIVVMLMSGMMISNAHPHLYWGEFGANLDHAWYHPPHFPGWATIPSTYNLALARHWHLFFAWIFAFGLLAFMLVSLVNRHIQRDLTLTRAELAPGHLWQDVKDHARLKFPTGEKALRFNVLQKITYIGVVFVVLPLLIVTGLSLSPGFDAVLHWSLDLMGGRSSARSIHFICAGLIAAFIVLHLVLVLLAGPYNEIRSMITGRFRVPPDRDETPQHNATLVSNLVPNLVEDLT
ncbi:cytochrome b/b6 domain-containing protein [Sphingomonas faeni]|uniref:cytochrome b/b6 domain-containing protein n=1 Tax=Sphingomonas faeni TaxID=185950 RepID=UPI0033630AC3